MNKTRDRMHEVHTHSRSIDFDGAEPQVITGYMHTGKTWVPSHAFAEWSHGKPIQQISLIGKILKKDGTPGMQPYSQRLETPAHSAWGKHYGNPAPAWLLELFDIEVPEGAAE